MPNLHITVADRIATYTKRDGAIVCGNSDYKILFTFDSEWEADVSKTARFIWNGEHTDVAFDGDVCPVPIIKNATEVEVGVYAGDLHTTTSAVIACKKSILCGGTTIRPEAVEQYRDEALEAAERAEAAAKNVYESGATFTPSVSDAGVLSWTNNKGLPNPEPVNIKGVKGDKGDKGNTGETGAAGANGKDGVGIAKIEQTNSVGNGKIDIYTITLTDGSTSTFSVTNGNDGKDGTNGKDGYTPVKGTDYFTAADKAELKNAVLSDLTTEQWVFTLENGSTVTKEVLLK